MIYEEDSAAFIELWERLKLEEKKKSLKANIKLKSKEHRAWEKQKQKSPFKISRFIDSWTASENMTTE